MLDAGHSMLDKDLPFTDPPSAENLKPNYLLLSPDPSLLSFAKSCQVCRVSSIK